MSAIIGSILTLIAALALLASVRAKYQLRKLGNIIPPNPRKDFLLYTFWISLLIGGILLIVDHAAYAPALVVGVSSLLIQLGIQTVGLYSVYRNELTASQTAAEDDEVGGFLLKQFKHRMLFGGFIWLCFFSLLMYLLRIAVI